MPMSRAVIKVFQQTIVDLMQLRAPAVVISEIGVLRPECR
jgi:hypothetical protein